ncbi:MAG: pectate lyase [Acidobacteriota bacterium]
MHALGRLFRRSLTALLCSFTTFGVPPLSAQEAIDLSGFRDSAHHWYDIHDGEHVIEPLEGKPKYPAADIVHIADNILLFQKDNGGWAKNYDMQAVLSPEQRAIVLKTKKETNTTFDNGTTHSQVAYLAEAFRRTNEARYKEGCLRGIDFILRAQYANGGWPQFYPEKKGYARFITFNDGAMIGVMNVLHQIVRNDEAYRFIDDMRRRRIRAAFERGIDCILRCQIVDRDTLTVWCQQHDEQTLKPQSARTFEPAAIGNQESAEIVEFLMSIDHPTSRIIRSVDAAAAWFEHAMLRGIRIDTVRAPEAAYQYHTVNFDRIVVSDPAAPPLWPRYTEPGTHRPLFCNRDGKTVYSLAEVERERRTGYGWYTDAPKRVLVRYAAWKKNLNSR